MRRTMTWAVAAAVGAMAGCATSGTTSAAKPCERCTWVADGGTKPAVAQRAGHWACAHDGKTMDCGRSGESCKEACMAAK